MIRSPDDPIIYDSLVKRIRVGLKQNPYDVIIGRGLLRRVGHEVQRLLPAPGARVFVVTSANIRRHWGEALEQSLRRAKLSYELLEMSDGEPAKRLKTVERLAEKMVAVKADRKSLVVAFGGGVVGDCAGFLAAVFLRGIPVVQVPTTLLAQVDASVGGKTGVNLRAGKNLIGAFHQPKAVLVDPELLSTLEEREFRAGLFESLKCGVIRDQGLFDFMRQRSQKVLARDGNGLDRIITDSIRVKAAVVAADEKEADMRRILNFGHTVGHALEAATAYTQLLHGEAVGLGMIAAATIACDCGYCEPETAGKIIGAVEAYGPLPRPRCGVQKVVDYLFADKKTEAGSLNFVLPLRIGKVKIANDVPPDVVRQAVEQIRDHG